MNNAKKNTTDNRNTIKNISIIENEKQNKLKVAVIMIGNLRSNVITFDRMQKYLFDLYDCDLYVATYNKRYNIKWANNEDNERMVTDDDIIPLYKKYIKHHIIVDQDKFFENYTRIQGKNYMFDKDLDRLYTIEKFVMFAYDIFRRESHINSRNYDIVLKIRPDIYLNDTLDLTIPLNDNQIIVPDIDSGAGFNDHMAFGKPKIMEKYFTYYQHYNDMDNKDIDVSMIELGLRKHMEFSGVDIIRRPLKYVLKKDARQQRIMFFGRKKNDFYIKKN